MKKKYSTVEAQAQFAGLVDRAAQGETITITQQGKPDVMMLPASEVRGLLETVHLLRSPANAERLLRVLARVRAQIGQ